MMKGLSLKAKTLNPTPLLQEIFPATIRGLVMQSLNPKLVVRKISLSPEPCFLKLFS